MIDSVSFLFCRKKKYLSAVAATALVAGLLSACANASDDRVGMSLHFINRGTYSIGVHRFAPDGITGPVPGALGPDGNSQELNKQDSQVGAHMSFMPADSKRGIPQFVDIEWTVTTPEISEAQRQKSIRFKEYSTEWREETQRIYAMSPMHRRRIDLSPILTPELLAQVRVNRRNTLLKLKVVFTDDDVTVTASPEVWR